MSTTVKPDAPFEAVQQWSAYTSAQHEVWRILYSRRMAELTDTGSRVFLNGVDLIGLDEHHVPNLSDVNDRLDSLTGWRAVPVTGFIPARDFFACLSVRRFPTTITVRPRNSLEYVTEPDIFHDVFGHVPLHSDPVFANFLQQFGEVASCARTETQVTQMARLFWFTVEFGLVEENGAPRVYGSGLISSTADAANALSRNCTRRRFSLDAVIDQPFEIDRLQDVLFVVESFDELFQAIVHARERIGLATAGP